MSTPAVGSPGDNRAFVDGSAITLPVVIDSTHNQFKYDGTDYVVASGTYVDLKQVAHAFNAALASSVRLDTVVVASSSPFVVGALRFTAHTAGVNTKSFATGTTHDAITRFGLTNGAALANGAAPISTGVSYAADLTSNQTPPSGPAVAGNPSVLSSYAFTTATDIAGDDAGPIAVVGISAGSDLVSVIAVSADDGTATDLTSEFTVSDDDEIDNTGGTDTTDLLLDVVYADESP